MLWLNDRQIIEISGIDQNEFLQSLITNDIKLLENQKLLYTVFLNASGRFFADFFIYQNHDKFFIDCHQYQADEIIKKFNLYKLRSKVEIFKNSNIRVFFNTQNIGFLDPRVKNFGFRFYDDSTKINTNNNQSLIYYHQRRIDFKVPEGIYDLQVDKLFVAEYDFDNLNAISYKKGCYLGQETTARNHYRGSIRKKIFKFEIINFNDSVIDFLDSLSNLNSLQIEDENLKFFSVNNLEILSSFNNSVENKADFKSIGLILSMIANHQSKSISGLALIKFSEDETIKNDTNFLQNLSFLGNKVLITN